MSEEAQAVFYELRTNDDYFEAGDVKVEVHRCDMDYPLSVTAKLEDGREIGLVMTKELIHELMIRAWALNLI